MAPWVRLTRRVQFSAAHRYHRADWDDSANLAAFGDNVKLHGHNYAIEATVEGEIDPATGMCADLGPIEAGLQQAASDLGYRDLSHGVPGLEGKIPTTENLALLVWERLLGNTGRARLVRVRVFESADLYAEVGGEASPARGALG